MTNYRELTLAELVNQNTGAAVVLEKYALDFCCKGKRTFADACQSQGLDSTAIGRELEEVFSKPNPADTSYFQTLPLDLLADYIVERHHRYVRQMMPLITAHTEKVALRHGEGNPNLVEIAEQWRAVVDELTTHMFKEEQILFPYIKRLWSASESGNPALTPRQSFVSNPIRVMEMEHETVGELMQQIKELSNNFTPPLIACTTYRLSFNELKEFEEDLHRHIHLENNLLFPKAIKLETAIISGFVMSETAVSAN